MGRSTERRTHTGQQRAEAAPHRGERPRNWTQCLNCNIQKLEEQSFTFALQSAQLTAPSGVVFTHRLTRRTPFLISNRLQTISPHYRNIYYISECLRVTSGLRQMSSSTQLHCNCHPEMLKGTVRPKIHIVPLTYRAIYLSIYSR